MKPGHRLSPVRSSIVETAAIETGAALFAGCHLDRWLGYITDIMINQLGKAVLRRLRVRPHLVDGHEICRIDVPALSTPTYQTISKTERLLWERLPNSTRAVKDDEVTEFLQDRFGRSTGRE